jgi:HEAT repeat protein
VSHAFISYAHNDFEFAENLKHHLERANVEIWMDEERLRAGDDWREDIDKAIRDCFALVLIVSPASMNSQYVLYEWSFAWGAGKMVVPILYETVDNDKIHPRLDRRQYLNFTNRMRPWVELIQRLEDLRQFSSNKNLSKQFEQSEQPDKLTSDTDELDRLLKDLKSNSSNVRRGAAKIIGQLTLVGGVSSLREALKDNDWEVRMAAAQALGKIRDSNSTIDLLVVLAGDNDRTVRQTVIEALERVGNERAIQGIIDAFDDSDYYVRSAASQALIKIGSTMIPHLLTYLHNPKPRTRSFAGLTLARIGDHSVLPYLRKLLNDESGVVRGDAAEALGLMEDIEAVPLLIKLLSDKEGHEYGETEYGDVVTISLVCDTVANVLRGLGTIDAMEAVKAWELEQQPPQLGDIPF